MGRELMRTAVITTPGRIELQDRPIPTPDPGWLVARVRAVGICGTDLEMLDGTLPYLRSGRMAYPFIPGHEWSGEVAAVGEGVTQFAPGDRVTSETHVGCGVCERCRSGQYNKCESLQRVGIGDLAGACAEYVAVPARAAHRLPDSLDFVSAAVLEPATVAYYALSKAHLAGGEHVVVAGPGAIGLLAVGLARALGAGRVTLLGTRDARLALGREMGAAATVNVRTQLDLLEALLGRADVVVDAAGNAEFFGKELALLCPGGTLTIAGFFRGVVSRVELNQIVTRNLTVVGSLGSPGVWERVINLMAEGRFDPGPIVTHQFPLAQVEQAFRVAADRETGAVKVIVRATEW